MDSSSSPLSSTATANPSATATTSTTTTTLTAQEEEVLPHSNPPPQKPVPQADLPHNDHHHKSSSSSSSSSSCSSSVLKHTPVPNHPSMREPPLERDLARTTAPSPQQPTITTTTTTAPEEEENGDDGCCLLEFPSWHVPTTTITPKGTNPDNHHKKQQQDQDPTGGGGDGTWRSDGPAWWDQTTMTTTTSVLVQTQQAWQQLQDGRHHVGHTIQAWRKNQNRPTPAADQNPSAAAPDNHHHNDDNDNNDNNMLLLKQVHDALKDYAQLLHACHEELQALLAEEQEEEEQPPETPAKAASTTIVPLLSLPWTRDNNNNNDAKDANDAVVWTRPHTPNNRSAWRQWQSVLHWEQSHVYWNLAVWELEQARLLLHHGENKNDKDAPSNTTKDSSRTVPRRHYKEAGTHWQTAASYLQSVRTTTITTLQPPPQEPADSRDHHNNPTPNAFDNLAFYEAWMMAEAQRAAYQFVVLAPRPSPLMMAKLAAGAVPLYRQAAALAQTNHTDNPNPNAQWCRAWQQSLTALAEYHQATVQSTKALATPNTTTTATTDSTTNTTNSNNPHVQAALWRLQHRASPLVHQQTCHEWNEMGHSTNHQHNRRPTTHATRLALWYAREWHEWMEPHRHAMHELEQRLLAVVGGGGIESTTTAAPPPHVTEISPQTLVQVQPGPVLQRLLSSSTTTTQQQDPPQRQLPLFPVMTGMAQQRRTEWETELHALWQQTVHSTERSTEQARQQLADVHLPHALTALQHQQQQSQQQQQQSKQQQQVWDEASWSTATTTTSVAAATQYSSSTGSSSWSTTHTNNNNINPEHDYALHLWHRVQRIQCGPQSSSSSSSAVPHHNHNNNPNHNNNGLVGLSELQQGLWELRDFAQQAHGLIQDVQTQLEQTVELERSFAHERQPHYPSRQAEIEALQETYWHSVQQYQALLDSAAQGGDQVLFGSGLDFFSPTNPKIQLLSQLTWGQLERLVVSSKKRNRNRNNRSTGHGKKNSRSTTNTKTLAPSWNTNTEADQAPPVLSLELQTCMERLHTKLVDLSTLLQHRHELVQDQLPRSMKQALAHVTQHLWTWKNNAEENDTNYEHEWQRLMQDTQPQIQSVLQEIATNVQEQTTLMHAILEENTVFTRLVAAESGKPSSSKPAPLEDNKANHDDDDDDNDNESPRVAVAAAAAAAVTDDEENEEQQEHDQVVENAMAAATQAQGNPYYHRYHSSAARTTSSSSSSASSSSSSSAAAAERALIMVEEALEEMEQFTTHWQQGEAFYQGVIPKLQKLLQQVSEVSTRFAIERYEYDDQVAIRDQEAKDAEMAAQLAQADQEQQTNNNTTTTNDTSSHDDTDHTATGTDATLLPQHGRQAPSQDHSDSHDLSHDSTIAASVTGSSVPLVGTVPPYEQSPRSSPETSSRGTSMLRTSNSPMMHDPTQQQENHSHHRTSILRKSSHQPPLTHGMASPSSFSSSSPMMGSSSSLTIEPRRRPSSVRFAPTTPNGRTEWTTEQASMPQQSHSSLPEPRGMESPSPRHLSSSSSSFGNPTTHHAAGAVARSMSPRQQPQGVDDEKVASLVAMDFDPELVVAALGKYDNNVEQALNDLLGT